MILVFQAHWKLPLGIGVAVLILGLLASWIVGGRLCTAWNHPLKLPENFVVEQVSFPSDSGSTIHGWLALSQNNRGVVILQHGIRADKSTLVDRARFLSQAGYTVLIFDFQGHGESLGSRVTFGYLESRDAQAAVKFVKERFSGKPICVIGLSLGAAAAAMARPPLQVQAMVLEMMYPTVIEATKNRIQMRLGPLGRLLSPLLTAQLKSRVGYTTDDLRPIAYVEHITAPKLFVAGTQDRDTTLKESEVIYARAAEPKAFVPFEGAKHQDLLEFAPEQYKRMILDFLDKNLR
jgi:pimeloyl-ACP methyl ester carboxylesterase